MCEAKKCGDAAGTFNGMILLDEMSIQQDLQVVKRGHDWDIAGAVDLGPLVNGLEDISKKEKRNTDGLTLPAIHVCRIQWIQMASCPLWYQQC